MDFFLLAQTAEPVAAIFGSSFFKSIATYLLVAIAGLALFYPSLLAQIKRLIANLVEQQLTDKLPGAITSPLQQASSSVTAAAAAPLVAQPINIGTSAAAATDIGQLTQQRAAALKAACPKAPAELRLRWLEEGFDTNRAQADYIRVLESKLASIPTPTN